MERDDALECEQKRSVSRGGGRVDDRELAKRRPADAGYALSSGGRRPVVPLEQSPFRNTPPAPTTKSKLSTSGLALIAVGTLMACGFCTFAVDREAKKAGKETGQKYFSEKLAAQPASAPVATSASPKGPPAIEPAVAAAPQEQPGPPRPWYEGGNLHDARAVEWRLQRSPRKARLCSPEEARTAIVDLRFRRADRDPSRAAAGTGGRRGGSEPGRGVAVAWRAAASAPV